MGNINDWLNASQTTGSSGETQVTITCDENLSFTERSQTIKVTLDKTGTTAECLIKQKPAFAENYHIQQIMCVGTGELYTKIYEADSNGNIINESSPKYSSYFNMSGTKQVNNTDTEITALLKQMYQCYSYSSTGAVFNSSVVYKWDNTGQYDNHFIPVTKTAIIYPQVVSSHYGDGSYYIHKASESEIEFRLNISSITDFNLGFSYGNLLVPTTYYSNNTIDSLGYRFGYLGRIVLNLSNLKSGDLGFGNPSYIGLQLQWGNTKKFDYYTNIYSQSETKGFLGLPAPLCYYNTDQTTITDMGKLLDFSTVSLALSANVNKFSYTGTDDSGTSVEDVYQGAYYPMLYDLNRTIENSKGKLTYKFYSEADFRDFETPYSEWTVDETPAHEIFSTRYGLAIVKAASKDLSDLTVNLSYISVNE